MEYVCKEILKRLEGSVMNGEANLSVASCKVQGSRRCHEINPITYQIEEILQIILPVTLENRIKLLPVAMI